MKLSVVIPAYNEIFTIGKIVSIVEAELKSLCKSHITDYEIIIVDDASTDGSADLIRDQFQTKVKYLISFQEKNLGKGAAIKKGFSLTTGDIVLIQDADLEYSPSDYLNLISPILENKADVVYGSRFKGEVSRVLNFWHYLGNLFLTFLSNCFSNLYLNDMECCYKVFRGNIIRSMKLSSKRFGVEPEMTAKISKLKNIKIYEVPINYHGRTYLAEKKIGWKDGFSALWCIIKYNIFTSKKESFTTIPVSECQPEEKIAA